MREASSQRWRLTKTKLPDLIWLVKNGGLCMKKKSRTAARRLPRLPWSTGCPRRLLLGIGGFSNSSFFQSCWPEELRSLSSSAAHLLLTLIQTTERAVSSRQACAVKGLNSSHWGERGIPHVRLNPSLRHMFRKTDPRTQRRGGGTLTAPASSEEADLQLVSS